MPFFLLMLLVQPLRVLLGGSFILTMLSIGVLAIIHPARMDARHVAAAIEQARR